MHYSLNLEGNRNLYLLVNRDYDSLFVVCKALFMIAKDVWRVLDAVWWQHNTNAGLWSHHVKRKGVTYSGIRQANTYSHYKYI